MSSAGEKVSGHRVIEPSGDLIIEPSGHRAIELFQYHDLICIDFTITQSLDGSMAR